MFAFGGSPDLSQQVTEKVGLVSKVVWPALATLVPAGVTAAFKWSQDHSRGKLRVQLTERVSTLAKAIAELPPEPEAPASLIATTTPHVALTTEMNEVLRELTALQTRAAQRRFAPGFSAASAISKLRAALLLYKPKGALAWMLHLSFFTYLVVLGICLLLITSGSSVSPTNDTAASAVAGNVKAGAGQANATPEPGSSDTFTNVVAFIFVFGIAGIPPMVIRYYASKIHRRQMECLAGTVAAPKGVPGKDAAGVMSAAV
jgi:hypothetical protein